MAVVSRSTVTRRTIDDVTPARRPDYWVGALGEGLLETDVGAPEPKQFGSCLGSAMADARFDRLGVGEVGRRVGLNDASHFIGQCRLHLGATPAELRRGR